MKRLAIITTHPIQYYAPVFKLLHERKKIEIMVFYTWGEASKVKYDPGFGTVVGWDVPTLEGYPYAWAVNTATDPGTHHFKGVITPGLIAQIKQWKPDALLVFGWAYQSHLKILRHFKGRVPVYFRGDSTLLDEPVGIKEVIRTIFLKWVYRHVDHAFYPGRNTKAYFEKFGLHEDQLSFAPHAVDNERFARDRSAEAKELRCELAVRDTEILVLFAGKFESKKSPVELLEAFLKMNKTGVHLLFVGNGALEEKLKSMAAGSKKVHFMAFQNQTMMPVIFQASDLFCLPSKGPGETWGLAVNEAMACGKAILVSDKVGCAIDLVKKGHNGDIFESGNKRDLADKLNKLSGSQNVLKEMGENSAALIQSWSFLRIAEALETKVNETN
jgi:glycosyltransferase involved in cell wall biosynthesis